MFRNSTELLDYALRELQVAVEQNKGRVEIELEEYFQDDESKIKQFCNKFEIGTITELLREEFKDYDIKSIVKLKGHLKGIITFSRGPCSLHYPLVWVLTLRNKKS